jgi:hypothetical protein
MALITLDHVLAINNPTHDTLPDEPGSCASNFAPQQGAEAAGLRWTPPYFFGSGGCATGLSWSAANGEGVALTFGLFCLGFFGSRPLRF